MKVPVRYLVGAAIGLPIGLVAGASWTWGVNWPLVIDALDVLAWPIVSLVAIVLGSRFIPAIMEWVRLQSEEREFAIQVLGQQASWGRRLETFARPSDEEKAAADLAAIEETAPANAGESLTPILDRLHSARSEVSASTEALRALLLKSDLLQRSDTRSTRIANLAQGMMSRINASNSLVVTFYRVPRPGATPEFLSAHEVTAGTAALVYLAVEEEDFRDVPLDEWEAAAKIMDSRGVPMTSPWPAEVFERALSDELVVDIDWLGPWRARGHRGNPFAGIANNPRGRAPD